MAGPLNPPKTLPSLGRRVSRSTAMARMVLMSERASAPPSSAARAISTMSATLGDSLAMSGRRQRDLAAATIARVASGNMAGQAPFCLTLGQEMFNS